MWENQSILALYTRTSLEDYGKAHRLLDQSLSITCQRNLIRDHISRHSDLQGFRVVEYIDDGFTGTNTQRPRFQDMIRDVQAGLIGVVIVKDLSRLGRSYLEVGDYLERVFPAAGVRIVAINDSYDSNDYVGTTGGLDVAFRNFIYGSYSKDLSEKVRSAMQVRMEKGKFINHTPYGYSKSPDDKHMLIPDPETAPIVREIFTSILAGKTTSQVAKALNDRHVPTPLQYKQHKLKPACQERELLWSHATVLNILHNYRYTGAMINHTRESRFLRDPNQRRTAPKEWIVTEGTHAPLVTKAEFEQANALLRHPKQTERQNSGGKDAVFYCGHCGRKLQKTYGNDTYFSCQTHKYQSETACGDSRLTKTELEAALIPVFRAQLDLLGLKVSQHRQQSDVDAPAFVRSMGQLELSIGQCDQEKLRLFEAYHENAIDLDTFLKKKEELAQHQEDLRRESTELEAKHRTEVERQRAAQKTAARMTDLLAVADLPEPQLLEKMYESIDKVLVYHNGEISVRWKLQDLFSDLIAQKESA